MILALAIVALLWRQGPETADALKQAGVERIYVADVSAWKAAAGIDARDAGELAGWEKVLPPTMAVNPATGSATVSWIDANGWRFERGLKRALYPALPRGRAALAAAEAWSYGVDAVLEAAPEDLPALARVLAFFRRVDAPRMPIVAQVGVVDDGSELAAETMNLLARRNLLFKVVRAPDPKLAVNVQIGSAEFPKEMAEDPVQVAQRVRKRLGDANRLVRVFGSHSVLVHLTGEGRRQRLYLLNYTRQPAKDIRVRILGSYADLKAAVDAGAESAQDRAFVEGATEFTLRSFTTCAVVDLEKGTAP